MTLLQPPSFMQNRADHTAQEDRLYLGGVVNLFGGVGGLALAAAVALVRAQAAPNMSVIVAKERFYIPGTESVHQGIYHGYNDGDVTVTIAASSPSLPRIDIIVANVQDQFYSTSNNLWAIGAVSGTPAGSPIPPAAPNNALIIANIAVAANATTVTNANITNNAQLASGKGGIVSCTSTTRPTTTWPGLVLFETDTALFKYRDTTNAIWKTLYLGEERIFGTGSATITTGNSSSTGTTSFGSTMSAVPHVHVQETNNEAMRVNVTAVTTTNFTWYCYFTNTNTAGINHTQTFDYRAYI